ncbi:MAG: hypothetical protein ACLUUO_13195 [Sellimonas intestinalis]
MADRQYGIVVAKAEDSAQSILTRRIIFLGVQTAADRTNNEKCSRN